MNSRLAYGTAILVVLLSTLPPLLASDPPLARYVVATRGVDAEQLDTLRQRGRLIHQFRVFDGYAAELTDEEVARLRSSPSVRYIERDLPRYALEPDSTGRLRPHAGDQRRPYGVDLVGAPLVWRFTRGAGVKVAVIDTGIDRRHPDLAANFHGGHDFFNNDDDPYDDNGHGTHVAGTIAALDNDVGVIGVAPQAEIYSLKVLDRRGYGTMTSVMQAVEWAIEHDMDVINLSLGATEGSAAEEEVFARTEAAGILTVAASGNNGPLVNFPAAYPSVLAVGAIDKEKKIATFSNRGKEVAVVGPGVDVDSTFIEGAAAVSEVRLPSGELISASALEFSGAGKITGKLVDCALGLKASDFPSDVAGNIALIERGEATFAEKTRNAVAAGARGVIIFNRVAGVFYGTLVERETSWPVTMSVSRDIGLMLKETLPIVTMHLGWDNYTKLNGTSMATPHVAGVAALVKALARDARPQDIKSALILTALDLGPEGWDSAYGYGLINAFDAASYAADLTKRETVPESPEKRP